MTSVTCPVCPSRRRVVRPTALGRPPALGARTAVARTDISAASLVRDLQVLHDPRRPVRIVAIMLGRAGDLRALRRIAATTNGQAVAVTRSSRLGQVIFRTVTRTPCQPSCASQAAS